MAKFYGTIKGARDSVATKTGTRNSGVVASVQSWDGSLVVDVCENGGKAFFRVWIAEGSSRTGEDLVLAGTFDELREIAKACKGYGKALQ